MDPCGRRPCGSPPAQYMNATHPPDGRMSGQQRQRAGDRRSHGGLRLILQCEGAGSPYGSGMRIRRISFAVDFGKSGPALARRRRTVQ